MYIYAVAIKWKHMLDNFQGQPATAVHQIKIFTKYSTHQLANQFIQYYHIKGYT